MRAGLLGLLLAALLWAAPAQAADVVGNPGLVTLTAVPAGSVNGLALDGFTAQGTVDPDGELLFPSAGTTLPEGVTPSYDDGSLDLSAGSIEFTPTLDATGTIDPAAGASTLLVPARGLVQADAVYDPSPLLPAVSFQVVCDIPGVAFQLTTESTGPPAADLPTPYDEATGLARMVGSLSLPPVATWDCDADGGFGADLADVGFILDYVAGLAAAEYDDAPLVLAARFEPAPRAPVAPTDPSPGGGAPTPGPPAGTMSGGVPSNVFTLGRAASSPTGVGTLVLNLPGPGVVSAIATASVTAGAARRIAVARVKKNVAKAGRVALRLKPSRRAKAILRKAGRLRSSVKITYTPTGGSPRSSTKALTFKLKRRRR